MKTPPDRDAPPRLIPAAFTRLKETATRPPSTFTRNGSPVVTILTPADGKNLPPHIKEFVALSLARNSAKHADAIVSIIAHGLADDAADADALIYAAESTNN